MITKERFLELTRFNPKVDSPQSQYYWNVYNTFKSHLVVPQVNWSGIAFGSFLFLYRRMYLAFFLMLGCELIIENYMYAFGFDRAMAHAYGSFAGNLLTALSFNSFYLIFLKMKEPKTQHIGTHVRLFTPLAVFLAVLFGSMVFQFIGLHWKIAIINRGFNYVVLAGFFYMIALYVKYIFQPPSQSNSV